MLTVDANVWVAAFDPHDRFHAQSAAFLLAATRRGLALHSPAFMVVEAGCALARRANSAEVGFAVREGLKRHPSLALHPLDSGLLHTALEIGTRQLLRGADSLYAATAGRAEAPLVSWDEELVERAGAITPADWLTANT